MSVFREHKTSADRSAADRRRHRDKIEKAIREGIHNIVADESIIGESGTKKIRIPVKGIKEYQFVFGKNSKGAGSAEGHDVKRGQKIGKGQQSPSKGSGQKPGDDAGTEMYEIEISLDELASYLFDSLELPDLEKKQFKSILGQKMKRRGHRNKGIWPRLAKKETVKRRLKRRASAVQRGTHDPETDESFPFRESDLRYKHIDPTPKENSNAVIFFIMDVSGSMTTRRKYIARSFYFLLYQFLRYRYENIEIVFIAHTSEAKEVTENEFFTRVSDGGTFLSTGIEKTLEIIETRYHPSSWNIYAFHCSDGDNWPTDDEKALEATLQLKNLCQLYAYCEIIPYEETTKEFMAMMSGISRQYLPHVDEKFKMCRLGTHTEIWTEFKRLFGPKMSNPFSSVN